MEGRKIVLKETAIIAVGELLCCGIMVGVFALLHKFSMQVVLGAFFGWLLTVANFFCMAVGSSLAADKAQEQNVSGGKAVMKSSMILRLLVLFVLMFALAKSGICDPVALILPLAFVRPVLMFGEFFRKKG